MLRTRLIAGRAAWFVLSAVFAAVMTIIAIGETMFEPLRVDPSAPAPVTLRIPTITMPTGRRAGSGLELGQLTLTVERGTVVSDPVERSIVRMYERSRRPPPGGAIIGLAFIYFLVAQMLIAYLRRFIPGRGALLRTQVGILGLSVGLLMLAKLFLLLTAFSPFVIPVAAVTLWTALYFERRAAFLVTIVLALLTSSLLGFRPTTAIVFVSQGLTASLAFRDLKHPGTMMTAGLVSGVMAAMVVVPGKMLFEGGIDVTADLAAFQNSDILGALAGGILSGFFGYIGQEGAVLALGTVTRRRLVDLTDLDQPLLKKMASEAPGSWEHSRAMANLAEAASAAIGADSLLTRVGAYYHDLGKTIQAKYYVENLEPGEQTPHALLEPHISADAIMAHVVEGTRILREGGIPEPVVEFAYTHHGTSVIEYFWHRCIEQGNPHELTENSFRYPGMRPRTKETAILMLVDSIEAAARTVDPPTREKFQEVVQRIVFVKLQQGQLDESGLTVEDIRVMTTRIVEQLASAYHSRIKYPWQHRQERGEKALPIPGVATEADVRGERQSSDSMTQDAPAEPGASSQENPTVEEER